MFSIPYTFANEEESYITISALRRFAQDKSKNDLKTTAGRGQLIQDIEKYANQSIENKEIVLEWLDRVLVEGIKDVQVKYIKDFASPDLMRNDDYINEILLPQLADLDNQHLCGSYSDTLQVYRFDIVEDGTYGRKIRLFLGKLISTHDKTRGAATTLYPVFVEVFVDVGIIVARAKSKSGMYKYMEPFLLEDATSTTAEKQMNDAIKYVCELFSVETLQKTESSLRFRNKLYCMLEKYTKTPREIEYLIECKDAEIGNMVDILVKEICELPHTYIEDVKSNIHNMVEKYFSISYIDKNIFTKDRDAYPLKLNATDEEDSRVEQTAAMEEPLQSKAIFFDNKKMLQKSQLCDGVLFVFHRINTKYCKRQFKVKIIISKDFCTLKFTEYTMEEDIINVLFSLINATRNVD